MPARYDAIANITITVCRTSITVKDADSMPLPDDRSELPATAQPTTLTAALANQAWGLRMVDAKTLRIKSPTLRSRFISRAP